MSGKETYDGVAALPDCGPRMTKFDGGTNYMLATDQDTTSDNGPDYLEHNDYALIYEVVAFAVLLLLLPAFAAPVQRDGNDSVEYVIRG